MPSPSSLDIPAYLASSPIPYNTLTPLSGGTANFVYRLTSASHPSLILKHAEPYIASQPHIPLPVARMAFEHRALTQLPAHLPPSAHHTNIALPQVHHYNPENHVLVMDDCGSTTLKQAYPTLSATDLQTYGHQLGVWLAHLHASTRDITLGDNNPAKTIARYPYTNLSSVAASFDLEPTLGERINAHYGALVATDDDCICHGDFWPGNILLGERGEMAVVDWEMVRRGCGVLDVGQFAAEAWLLERFHGERGLLGAFWGGYRDGGKEEGLGRGRGREWVERVAVQMGVHLAFWPSRVQWGTREETREVVGLGNEILRMVEGGEVGWVAGNYLWGLVSGGEGEWDGDALE